jgi:GntR family transcriptional regulator, transcriptional repressor for pyruvate dehydrogenase complex
MNHMSNRLATGDTELFLPVDRDVRLSDKVAEQLLDGIVSGRLQPGDRLPSERELAQTFAVSRTVIREAVRSLVTRGLVVSQSGSRLRVTAMSPGAVSESMSLLVNSIGSLGYGKVDEVRTVLEMTIVGLAAERATPEDMSILRAAAEALLKPDLTAAEASRHDVAFHRELAQATKNELFVVLLDSIGDVLLDVRLHALSRPSGIKYASDAHRRIFSKVAQHDVAGARDEMHLHLAKSRVLIDELEVRTGE